jgi:hypothetical protein
MFKIPAISDIAPAVKYQPKPKHDEIMISDVA